MQYDGISRESLFLLADNRFRDSRDFYEAHKEEIKSGVIVPMRQIAGEIGAELLELDPVINANPVKMVSRIRRDTRYTKDKALYRENVWIMFMRDKHQWEGYPCFWFEVTPSNYSLGIGFFGDGAALMQNFRKAIRENTAEFRAAVRKCEKTGAELFGREYKRMPADCPKGMEPYYIKKSFGFIAYSGELDELADERIIEIIRGYYKAFSPMYSFLLGVSDETFAKGE